MLRVNEDTAVGTSFAANIELSENAAHLLGTIRASLPLLSDLLRADLFVYRPGDKPDEAVVDAESRPCTVPSVFSETQLRRVLVEAEEPAIFRALNTGSSVQESCYQPDPSLRETYDRAISRYMAWQGVLEKGFEQYA